MADPAASAVSAARKGVIRYFTDQGATAQDHAVHYTPMPGIEERQFARLRHAGVLGETGDGRFWYDKPMDDELRGRAPPSTAVGIAVGLAGAAALGALMWYRRRNRDEAPAKKKARR